MHNGVRRSTKTLPANRVREVRELAEQIDHDEGRAIKSKGMVFKARHDALRNVVRALKAERERLGLSLGEVGERSWIGKANLSRLENELEANPTIDTLMRYAAALNKEIRIDIAEAGPRRRAE